MGFLRYKQQRPSALSANGRCTRIATANCDRELRTRMTPRSQKA